MIRIVFLVTLSSAGSWLAGLGSSQAGGEPSYPRLLPPEVAYRDPTYLPPPPPVSVTRVPRSLNLPLYNEPPPRF